MMPFLNVFRDSDFDGFWMNTGAVLEDLLVRGVLSKLLFYIHNIDVFKGGGFACPHEKGKKSASEFKLDSNASCLTFLELSRSHFGS